jgi:hypothetical protein
MQTEPMADATVVDPIIGKQLTSRGEALLMVNADGTISGMAEGTEIRGAYTANSTEICSTITSPANYAGAYCSVPEYGDGTVIFNRRDGSQSALYMIGS